MKRAINSILAIAAVLGMASCAKELEQKVETPAGECNIVVTATIEQTKVAFTEETNALKAAWEVGDKVFGASESGACTFSVASVDGNVATLTLESGVAPGEGNHVFLGYAPQLSVANIVANEVALPFDNQNATLAQVKNHAYMYAQATVGSGELNLTFQHGVAILEAAGFTGIPMDAEPFTLTVTGSNLTGSAKFANTAGVWGVVPVNSGAITVTTIGAGSNFVVVPPTAAATDLTFTLVKGGNTYEAKIASTKQIVAGKCYNVGTLAFSPKAAEVTGTDKVMVDNGKNLDDFVKFDFCNTFYWNAYYNTTSNTHSGKTTGSGGTLNMFYATGIYNQFDIPVGSYVVQMKGYRHRPEYWNNLGAKQAARGVEIKAESADTFYEIDEAWWSGKNYRAFNIAKNAGSPANDAEKQAILDNFAIYIPKTALVARTPDTAELDAMMTAAGFDVTTYTKVSPELVHYAYWYSQDQYSYNVLKNPSVGNSAASNNAQFSGTKETFTNAELPNGTVIVLKSGYNYRPEGWTDFSQKLAAGRPAITTEPITVVNDAWWTCSAGGTFTTRAFNIQKLSAGSAIVMGVADHISCESALAFYVPKGEPTNVDVWKTDAAGQMGLGLGAGSATEDFLTYADGIVSWTANTTGAPRSATLTVNGSTIKVTQLEAADFKGNYTFTTKSFSNNTSLITAANQKLIDVTIGDARLGETLEGHDGVTYTNQLGVTGLYDTAVMDATVVIDYEAKTAKFGAFMDARNAQPTTKSNVAGYEYVAFLPEMGTGSNLSANWGAPYNFIQADLDTTKDYCWIWFNAKEDLTGFNWNSFAAATRQFMNGDKKTAANCIIGITCAVCNSAEVTASTVYGTYNVIYQANVNNSATSYCTFTRK